VRRRNAAWAVVLVLPVAGAFAACGIDENGLLNGDASLGDVTQPDVASDVAPPQDAGPDVTGFDVVQLSCLEAGTPIDASCLGTAVPTGWSPVAYRENAAAGCNGAANFQALDGITNPTVPNGQCYCSACGVAGSWTCTATLGSTNTCTFQQQSFTASGCYNQGGVHFGGTLARSGDAGCTPGTQTDASITSTPASVCVPQTCEADFCALVQQGFQGCIQNTGQPDAGCPAGFNNMHQAAPAAAASCTCPSCNLTNNNAACSGTVTALTGASCTGNVVDQTRALDVCQNTTTGYMSVYYDAGPTPEPACQANGQATGTAALVAPLTICCK
jgi:hypothetical protein